MKQTQQKWPKSYPTGRTARRAGGARALVGTALACALLSAPAAGTAQAAPRGPVPVGSWKATVVREGATYDVTLSFATDRSVCLVSPAGASKGRWHHTGRDAFDYRIRELWHDAGGALEGWVDIAQSAKRTGAASFAGSGTSTVHGADGTVVDTVPVEVTGVRTGPPDGSACG
ncbi:hypothetical protein IM697_37700 [Streptomyces ferrugineus]|uniref:Uncharacterized protein n=1 Tax=Streptomyces ferrugineus TaxID=1413221 RepID=A0A7M2SHA6_9ACTN|nr:hypothetical protein [Streptomyces ferrugineus]QOV35726.1 hypothetical protein IM697_37700 [Streptomyces ferrugineus]